MDCTCKKYNKTTDEIVEACNKHRKAAIALKDIGDKQKKKIDKCKEEIEKMKLEANESEKQNDEIKKRNNNLEMDVARLEKKLQEKVNVFNKSEDEFEAENEFLKNRLEKMCRMNE